MRPPALAVIACAAILLSGCYLTSGYQKTIQDQGSAAAHLNGVAAAPKPVAQTGVYQLKRGPFLAARSFQAYRGMPLPSSLNRISFNSLRPVSLDQFAVSFTETYGIPVLVDSGDLDASPVTQDGVDQQTQAGQPTPDHDPERRIVVAFTGSGKELLDLVSNQYNVSWEYGDGRILFTRYVTRTFWIAALPATSKGTSLLDSGSGASGTTDGSNVKTTATAKSETSFTIDVWKDVESSLKAMVPKGSQVVVSPSTGAATVKTSPAAMEKVAAYMQSINRSLFTQVAITARVYSVTLSDSDAYRFDLQGFLSDALGSVSFVAPGSAIEGAASLVGTITDPQSRYNGSKGAVEALSQMDNVAVLTTQSVTTLNNQSVPVNVVDSRGYVPSVSVTSTDNNVTTQITTDTIKTGFIMNILPRVMADGTMFLQLQINLSELKAIEEFSSNGSSVQLPEIATRASIQQAVVRSGETLVLAGFESIDTKLNETGVGDHSFMLFGGTSAGVRSKTYLVVVVSPVVIDNSRFVRSFSARSFN